jgi:predicted KAP-like P-loop ATPase
VEFNAWLYQGYDDARAALMDVIASKLSEEAEKRKTGIEKTKDFLRRVNWLRTAKLTAGSAIALRQVFLLWGSSEKNAGAVDTSHLGFRLIQKIATIHASSGFIRGIPA